MTANDSIPAVKIPDYLLVTKEQRESLGNLLDRFPDLTGVNGTIGCDGAVVAHSPRCGLWFCIERDGYCHT